jgi:GT2 family glycosyltransferase
MRASIVIAAHNEGEWLSKTVGSCVETIEGFSYEIVVADDASRDGSIEGLSRRYPQVRVVRHAEGSRRLGVSPTKDLGARHARGEVLVFLDGHCKPQPHAVARLVADVEEHGGSAIVTPRVPALDCRRWINSRRLVGTGYLVELDTFRLRWLTLKHQRRHGRLVESPNLCGCCLAVARQTYDDLGGFDRQMRLWGWEDVDFGLTAWLSGCRVLNHAEAVIGHRFRREDEFDAPQAQVVANELRMARKHFTEAVWDDWLKRFHARHPAEVAQEAWQLFLAGREELERRREELLARRLQDEFWYAQRFRLDWPSLLRDESPPGPARRAQPAWGP